MNRKRRRLMLNSKILKMPIGFAADALYKRAGVKEVKEKLISEKNERIGSGPVTLKEWIPLKNVKK